MMGMQFKVFHIRVWPFGFGIECVLVCLSVGYLSSSFHAIALLSKSRCKDWLRRFKIVTLTNFEMPTVYYEFQKTCEPLSTCQRVWQCFLHSSRSRVDCMFGHRNRIGRIGSWNMMLLTTCNVRHIDKRYCPEFQLLNLDSLNAFYLKIAD